MRAKNDGEVVAKMTDKFGDEREIYRHGPNGKLKLAKADDTVSHKMSRVVAVLAGQRIKQRRERAGLSLEALCLRAGLKSQLPKARMWEIENAIRGQGTRLGTLYALAAALNCEATDLLPTVAEVAERAGITTQAVHILAAE